MPAPDHCDRDSPPAGTNAQLSVYVIEPQRNRSGSLHSIIRQHSVDNRGLGFLASCLGVYRANADHIRSLLHRSIARLVRLHRV